MPRQDLDNYEKVYKHGNIYGDIRYFKRKITQKDRKTIYSKGIEVDKNKNLLYKGEFINNYYYKGEEYNNGKLIYEGKFYYQDNEDNEEGSFYHGKGKEYNDDGTYFEGIFYGGDKRDGKVFYKNGKIKGLYEEGKYYEGDLQNDKANGQGILYYNKENDIKIYEGKFIDGKYEGKGTLFDTKNYKKLYEGEFKNGLPEGKGTLFNRDGSYYEAEFEDGYYKKGKGKKVLLDGSYYEGEFEDGHPTNKCQYFSKDGELILNKSNISQLSSNTNNIPLNVHTNANEGGGNKKRKTIRKTKSKILKKTKKYKKNQHKK